MIHDAELISQPGSPADSPKSHSPAEKKKEDYCRINLLLPAAAATHGNYTTPLLKPYLNSWAEKPPPSPILFPPSFRVTPRTYNCEVHDLQNPDGHSKVHQD